MKSKLVGFLLAVMSVATIGVVQMTSEALSPGQVNNSTPRCTVKADGPRGKAFDVKNNVASVSFKVTGQDKCKVKLSANSFYAPTMDGRPYDKQILFARNTKVFEKGHYTMRVALPTKSTKKKGCFYQVDLTYGVHNHTPVLAYGHGKIKGCGEPKPEPIAKCDNLTKEKLSDTRYKFVATATAKNKATISGYIFEVFNKSGNRVAREVVDTSKDHASFKYTQTTPGSYRTKVTVKTSLGKKSGEQCVVKFNIPKEEVTPTAICKDVTVKTIKENEAFEFTATAEVTGGATISGYDFNVYKNGTLVDTLPVVTTANSANAAYTQTAEGNYVVKAVVHTSLGDKKGAQCEAPFTVAPPEEEENPGVKVEKYVVNAEDKSVKYTRVGIDVAYDYRIKVTNTGDIDLTNVVVTDTPETGITLVSASQGTVDTATNTWTYTITELKVGASMDFVLSAKVPVEMAGQLTNTVCVDAPEVPGNPDDCDEADVDVKKVPVCDAETGKIISVDEDEADKYLPVDSDKCESVTVCNPETGETEVVSKDKEGDYLPENSDKCKEETPIEVEELPETGAAEAALQLVGATTLAGASAYYLNSRRRA